MPPLGSMWSADPEHGLKNKRSLPESHLSTRYRWIWNRNLFLQHSKIFSDLTDAWVATSCLVPNWNVETLDYHSPSENRTLCPLYTYPFLYWNMVKTSRLDLLASTPLRIETSGGNPRRNIFPGRNPRLIWSWKLQNQKKKEKCQRWENVSELRWSMISNIPSLIVGEGVITGEGGNFRS